MSIVFFFFLIIVFDIISIVNGIDKYFIKNKDFFNLNEQFISQRSINCKSSLTEEDIKFFNHKLVLYYEYDYLLLTATKNLININQIFNLSQTLSAVQILYMLTENNYYFNLMISMTEKLSEYLPQLINQKVVINEHIEIVTSIVKSIILILEKNPEHIKTDHITSLFNEIDPLISMWSFFISKNQTYTCENLTDNYGSKICNSSFPDSGQITGLKLESEMLFNALYHLINDINSIYNNPKNDEHNKLVILSIDKFLLSSIDCYNKMEKTNKFVLIYLRILNVQLTH